MPGAGAKFFAASSALMRHSIAWPCQRTSSWPKRELLAGGDQDLLAHDVDAGGRLGHAVLDLHARVHLQEEVLAVLEQALDRAGRVVADGPGGLDGDLADLRAQLVVDHRGRRLLDQLLVAALDRAVALAEVDDVAVLVGQHLDLDVARVGQVALEVDGRVAEELLALARGALERLLELVGLERDAEALAAAAAGRLDGDRVADVLGDLARRPRRSRPARWCPGTIGTPASFISSRARVLEPIASIADAGGPMNVMPGVLEALGERGVLGQEAVAGVHGLGAGGLDDLDQLVDVQVGLGGGPGAEQVRLVGAA